MVLRPMKPLPAGERIQTPPPDTTIQRRTCMAARLGRSLIALLFLAAPAAQAVHPDAAWDTAIGFPGAFSPNWSSGYDEEINALLAADLDGLPGAEIYAGGVFESIGQEQPPNELHFGVARWDGVAWQRLLHGLDRYEGPFDEQLARVRDLVLFDDGDGPDLYIGGDFNRAYFGPQGGPVEDNSFFAGNIVRWDGVAWTPVGSGLGDYGSVNDMVVFDDGSGEALYVAGDIRTNVGAPFDTFGRWDGVAWSGLGGAFRFSDGALGFPEVLLVYDDGTGPALYVGGRFDEAPGGVPARNIAKWDGTSWTGLGPGLGDGARYGGDVVRALARYDSGSGPFLYAGGAFEVAGTTPVLNIARWDGAAWSRLGHGLEPIVIPENTRGGVFALEVHAGELWVGGQFYPPVEEPPKVCRDSQPPEDLAVWNGSRWLRRLPGVFGTAELWYDPPGVFSFLSVEEAGDPALYVGGFYHGVGCVDETLAAKTGPNSIAIVRSTCPGAVGGGAVCGNGVCEAADGEDCLTCPSDCDGVQNGSPGGRYCCGAAGGENPVWCSDPRCQDAGEVCTQTPAVITCCGDGACQGDETLGSCFADCEVGAPGESSIQQYPGEQMMVTAWDTGSGLMEISYTPACDAVEHTVYLGDLAGVSSYSWTDAACNLGASGTATFEPGAGSVFFVVVGHDGAAEGSYGRDSLGFERPEDVGTPGCDLSQDLLGNVCQ